MPDVGLPLALPAAGLNLDTSPSQLDPLESPSLYNVLIHEPGQVRVRRGFKRKVNLRPLMTTPNADVPYGFMTWNSRGVIAYATSQDTWIPAYQLVSPSGSAPAGYSLSGGSAYGIWINADSASSWSATAFLGSANMLPLTPPIPYENATYGTSARQFSGLCKDGATRTGTRLIKWAGANVSDYSGSATINNGDVTGNFSVAPGTSLVNAFLRFTSETTGYSYSYQIKSHTAGQTAFTLYKPYGLGEGTASIANKSAAACVVKALDYVSNSPPDVQCVAVHYERLFVARPTLIGDVGTLSRGEYPNAIQWSDPAQPEKWDDTRVIQIDDRPDDAIMGLGHAGSNLAVFKRDRIYIVSGYSEQTFTVSLFTAELGCIDARSIVQYRDGCTFMSAKGIFYFDGSQLVELTQPRPGHGIRKAYRPLVSKDDSKADKYMHLQASQCLVNEHLLSTIQDNRTTSGLNDSYMNYLPNRTWVKWGNDEAGLQPYIYSPPNQYINKKAVGVFRTFVAELHSMFEPEDETSAASDRYDESYDTGGSAVTSFIPAEIQFKDLRYVGGDTGRVKQVAVEHNVHYFGAGDSAMQGWNVSVVMDPNLSGTATSVGEVSPRYIGNVSAPDYERYFTDTFLGGLPTLGAFGQEGSVMRIKLTNRETTGSRPHSMKLFTLRIRLEQTSSGRVDNPVLV